MVERSGFARRVADAVGRVVIEPLQGLALTLRGPFEYHGVRLDVRAPAVDLRLRSAFYRDAYEQPERRLVERHLLPDVDVVELGASLGFISCLIDGLLTPGARQIAVEAHPDLVPLLERNRDLNDAGFEVVHAAYKPEGGRATFRPGRSAVGGRVADDGDGIEVPATTLAEIATARDLERFVLVADIEGMEHDLVAEELELLVERCPLLIVELHEREDGSIQRTLDRLASAGFEVVEEDGDVVALRGPSAP